MDVQQVEDRDIEWVAQNVSVIAVVGLSPNESRPSWGVARYLQAKGKLIIPVNPGHAGHDILGCKVYASLTDIPKDAGVQMVDIFRQSSAVAGIVDEALEQLPDLKVIWTQLGVRDDTAARKARRAGIMVVQDRCPKIEFPEFL
ncbi:CoA-binding protein [Paracoccus sp. SM22M-07]|uniref:CoA-binding protein n=1 Tax=Paracoccus sp. SM22M-07 TaxID=1520813 RepID=UPI000918A46E|nr:CoA-binding protein [Paracoccus sp. SM22M-07]OJH45679.1 CoA-binding protein [Paracoccus sp. SM22M-07]